MEAEPLPVDEQQNASEDSGMKIDYSEDAQPTTTANGDDTDMKDDNDIATVAVDGEEAVMRDQTAEDANDNNEANATTTTASADAIMAVEDQDLPVPTSSSAPSVSSQAPPSLAISLPSPGIITAPMATHAGFSSPPLVQTSDNQRQTSALGHSAQLSPVSQKFQVGRHSPVITPSPEARYNNDPANTSGTGTTSDPPIVHPSSELAVPPVNGRQTQARNDLDLGTALATQHQHQEDEKLSQEQTVENQGERKTVVTQRQSLEPDEKGDTPARQENEVTIRQQSPDAINGDGEWHTIVETNQRNQGGDVASHGGRIQQVNHVKVFRRGEDSAAKGLSGGALSRPDIRKDLLSVVDLGSSASATDENVDEDSFEQQLAAQPVRVDFGDQSFTLFGPCDDAKDSDGEDLPVLFEDAEDHNLYFDQLEALFERLRNCVPDLPSRDYELELEFVGLGILLSEDNVYTRETSLYDFDRMYVGCGLPGRLHVKVSSSRGRFARDFNALASHVSQSYQSGGVGAVAAYGEDDAANADGGHEDEAAYQVEEEYVEIVDVADDNDEADKAEGESNVNEDDDDVVAEVEDPDHGGDAWNDDEDAQDQERVDYTEVEEEEGDEDLQSTTVADEADIEEPYEEEIDEQALADMDNENLTAYIEGVQEDYVLSETAGTQDETTNEPQVEEVAADENATNGDQTVIVPAPDENAAEEQATAVAEVSGNSAQQAESSGLKAPIQLELSYDTPLATGDEPPAVPVDHLDAVVDAVAASEAASAEASAANGAEPVVIDYDEAGPGLEGQPAAAAEEPALSGGSPGEKRSRATTEVAEANADTEGSGEGEAKRARLDETSA